MTVFQAVVYGIIQGLTEFLPVSSSAHLVLLPWFFGWQDPGLAFDVALHWGTLFGVLAYFRNDIVSLARGFFGSFSGHWAPENKLPWMIILGTIPAAAAGKLFEGQAETVFRSPWVTAVCLAVFAVVLYTADKRRGTGKTLEGLEWLPALLIGAAQGIAIIPGVSRSGISMSAALFFGFDRPAAVRFSFLLSIPLIFGAGLLKSGYLLAHLTEPAVLVGMLASAVSGFAAVHFLLSHVKTRSFTPFVLYRLLLAGVIAVWLILHP